MDAARFIPPELAGAVHLGWVPDSPRQLIVPGTIGELLGGGLPRGRICEVIGTRSSGRTSLIYAFLAAATKSAEVAAVVDVSDSFDPASAARAAIDLSAVLWARPRSARDALRCAELILAAGGFGLVVLDLEGAPLRRLRAYTWPRLARAAEKAAASLVILAPVRLAGSFAAMSVKMKAVRANFGEQGPGVRGQGLVKEEEAIFGPQSSTDPRPPAPGPLFEGLESYGVLVHNKRGPLRASRRVCWTLKTREA